MAGLVIVVIASIVTGVSAGAFVTLSFAIRREDRQKWSLRLDAPNRSTEAARTMVGISGSGWR